MNVACWCAATLYRNPEASVSVSSKKIDRTYYYSARVSRRRPYGFGNEINMKNCTKKSWK